MSAPEKTMAELAAAYGLAANEYQVVLDRLGREPNHVELGVFSVMWSEHCVMLESAWRSWLGLMRSTARQR